MARTKGPAYKMKSAAHGGPMRRNFPSAFKDEKDKTIETKKPIETIETKETPEVNFMFGSLSDDGTKIINEQGNWINVTKSTEGNATLNRAKKAGVVSGGPDI